MSLNDREILELNDLCNSMINDNLSRPGLAQLSKWVAESEDARRFYIRAMDQSASLSHYASEMQVEAPDLRGRTGRFLLHGNWMWLALAVSIVVGGAIWVGLPDTASPVGFEYVAKVTGVKACTWPDAPTQSKLGGFLRRGEHLELSQGFAEVTFDSGAVVVLKGPAVLDVNSAWDATLHRGAVTVCVPKQAIGFRVTNPAVEIVDLGTEFSMIADGQGTADVFVIRGEVEALPRSNRDRESILLRTNESRRFVVSGNLNVAIEPSLVARSDTPVSFDRMSKTVMHVYWSFDEMSGSTLGAQTIGFPPSEYDLVLKKRRSDTAHVIGIRNNGIRFDGRLFAKASFPGLSSNFPRTVTFWVRVPEDAALSDAYSMVAWRADSAKLGSRPVHIGWNRNPDEGPLGALRTDFSGGHAMGMTSLRDGFWHYVSIVFVPGIDPDTPVHVKQYVDGKLESNTVTLGPKLSIAGKKVDEEDPSLADVLWLGCRLGSSGPKKSRFRGEIDELMITDRSLDPAEITQRMDGQRFVSTNQRASP